MDEIDEAVSAWLAEQCAGREFWDNRGHLSNCPTYEDVSEDCTCGPALELDPVEVEETPPEPEPPAEEPQASPATEPHARQYRVFMQVPGSKQGGWSEVARGVSMHEALVYDHTCLHRISIEEMEEA